MEYTQYELELLHTLLNLELVKDKRKYKSLKESDVVMKCLYERRIQAVTSIVSKIAGAYGDAMAKAHKEGNAFMPVSNEAYVKNKLKKAKP
ncbi:hypothetical protein [Microviridae sp.]|nr:hypothetical protein [Microviridae sp.]